MNSRLNKDCQKETHAAYLGKSNSPARIATG
jgi:hypothetical protein